MCGIAGAVSFDPARPVTEPLLSQMIATLRHRGPDDGGVWTDGVAGLASRRLAVIDLSPRGRMPMANEDGSLHISFNGEVYNFQSLRPGLESRGHRLQSNTDTETILHLYEEEGTDCLRRLRGMFAFVLWDAPRRTLFVARDRLGKKPLFYYHGVRSFVFGSEPKALLQHPDVPAEPDPIAIHHYLAYGYVPSPASAFAGIRKLPPAHYLLVRDGQVSVHRYWSLRYRDKLRGSDAELTEQAMAVLQEAVRLRLISDVPLGALLSGGIDSGTIVALMRRLTGGPIRTFSIGFEQPEYDELAYARQVAARFETEHHEEVVRPSAAEILPRLVWHYNEPFADSSAVPTFAVSRMARQHVTVALTGDGGDESFLGYDRYLATELTRRAASVPRPVRRGLAGLTNLFPQGSPKSVGYRLQRLVGVLDLPPRRQYSRWMACADDQARSDLYAPEFAALLNGTDPVSLLERAYDASDAPTFVEASAHADVQLYLPDDLLVKMDIASMANSLEVRSPLLDHEVVEFAARLPRRLKLRGLVQKYLLKRAMKGVLPDAVLRRKKMGFGVPIDHWLRGELREMAHDVLLGQRARGRGYFRPDAVRRYLDEHTRAERRHHTVLWSLLMLELWHRMFIDGPGPAEAPSTL
jgi:asparagine synthase (glutamine-hydrolysing)